jgi:hypothetical protein
VVEVSREATHTAFAIRRVREEYRAPLTERLGRPGNGHRILDGLLDHPIVPVACVREWLGVMPAGTNHLVKRFVHIGMLREITGYARHRRFRLDPYLKLFEEHREARQRSGKGSLNTGASSWPRRGSSMRPLAPPRGSWPWPLTSD